MSKNSGGSDAVGTPAPSNQAEGGHQPAVPANGANGEKEKKREGFHDARGRFTLGNPGGPGNPRARQTALIRRAFRKATSAEDIGKLVESVLRDAKAGDPAAACEVLRRLGVKNVTINYPSRPPRSVGVLPRTVPFRGAGGCEDMPIEEFIRRYANEGPILS